MMARRKREARAKELLDQSLRVIYVATDRMFGKLLVAQWICAVLIAAIATPFTWRGTVRSINFHVEFAFFVGAVINALPLFVIWKSPGERITRTCVSIAQLLWSGVFIHLMSGRIEMHFHVFVSLAFIAFYRDYKILIPAVLTVVADHLIRGLLWPKSVYGVIDPQWWRFLEHSAWVLFEASVLIAGCKRSFKEMELNSYREADLEVVNQLIEEQVREKTVELTEALEAQKHLQTELLRTQKLESVGRLASGVAHEINTPVQFVSDSLHFVKQGVEDLLKFNRSLDHFQGLELNEDQARKLEELLANERQVADLSYLEDQMPKALERSVDGLSRVSEIVRSMKEFAHPEQVQAALFDVNRTVKNTVIMARNEYKYVADLECDLGEIPMVMGHGGELGQVLLNLIVNGAHSIEDKVRGTENRGSLTVSTFLEAGMVVMRVSDSGMGIPPEIREQIFDPFFTTKEVGKGTGQGLAIARNVIVKQLKGVIEVESEVGVGTIFTIKLPLEESHLVAA